MKTDPRTACGHQPRPASSQTNRCLPFCGLGAEEYVQGKATRCGMLQLDQQELRAGDFAGVVTPT